jgi:hypothetical protein
VDATTASGRMRSVPETPKQPTPGWYLDGSGGFRWWGVSSDGDGVVIVNAVCPGERVVEITLWRRTDSGPHEELWRIAGDAPLPERLDLGAVPDGMRTAAPLRRPSTAQEPLSLKVVTSELDSSYSMDFTLEDIPSQGVLSFGDVYTTDAAFAQAVFDDTPCGDPYSEKGSQQFARITLIVAGGAAVSGVSLFVAARHRRSR